MNEERDKGLQDAPVNVPHYVGHRQRLKERFEKTGAEGLQDYELLELILFRSIPRRDTKPIAKALLEEFGSFAEVIHAQENRLLEVSGVGRAVVQDLKVIKASSLRLMKSDIEKREALNSWQAVINYCRAAMAYETREQFRIIFLDKRNGILADEIQQEGTVDHTPVYVREVVKRALDLAATAVILVHNHPSGDPTPSRADIDMTRLIVKTAKPLGIVVHDHIIVGREGHASLRELGLM